MTPEASNGACIGTGERNVQAREWISFSLEGEVNCPNTFVPRSFYAARSRLGDGSLGSGLDGGKNRGQGPFRKTAESERGG